MTQWIEKLKEEMLYEIKKRNYNDIDTIIKVIKKVFDEIENSFKEVKLEDRPIVSTIYDSLENTYQIRFNDIYYQNNEKYIVCSVVEEQNESIIKVEIIVPQINYKFIEIATIQPDNYKPDITYNEEAEKVGFVEGVVDFSYSNFEWLVKRVFEYKV